MVLYTIRFYATVKKSNAWHLNYIGPADSTQALPNGPRNYFPCGGVSTWILIRHGFRAWPIEVVNFQFGEGWDTFSETHNLKLGLKSPCHVNESGFSILQSLMKVIKNLFTGGLVQICTGGNFMIHQVIMLPFVGIKHSVINKIQYFCLL